MTAPAILFSVLLSALLGCVYHLIRGGNYFVLFFYMVISVAGFFLGQYLGSLVGIHFFQVGTINIGMGVLVSIVFLIISGLISHPLS